MSAKESIVGYNSAQWFRVFLRQTGRTILYFPAVYYTTGLKKIASWIRERTIWYSRVLALNMSWRLLFTPLFGDYTRAGRFIGLGIRLVMLVFRLLIFLVLLMVFVAVFALYAALPLGVIYSIFAYA